MIIITSNFKGTTSFGVSKPKYLKIRKFQNNKNFQKIGCNILNINYLNYYQSINTAKHIVITTPKSLILVRNFDFKLFKINKYQKNYFYSYEKSLFSKI